MKIKLFGHPLNPRDLGASGPRLWKRAQNSIQDGLNESSVRPNGTSVMPILRSRKTQKFLKCFFFVEILTLVWSLKKHLLDKREIPLGPIYIGLYNVKTC